MDQKGTSLYYNNLQLIHTTNLISAENKVETKHGEINFAFWEK